MGCSNTALRDRIVVSEILISYCGIAGLADAADLQMEWHVLLCYVLKRILTFKYRLFGITEFGVFSVPTDFWDLFKYCEFQASRNEYCYTSLLGKLLWKWYCTFGFYETKPTDQLSTFYEGLFCTG